MTPERWKQVKATFQALLDQPAEARDAWLRASCAADAELRAEVQSLLSSHAAARQFLETPALASDDIPPESPAPGDTLGVYRIVERIGEGGMSVVYKAVRADDQFQQVVAVKVLKRGMDTDFLLRRFRTERQILAHFDHPNIAKIFDGGSTPDGRPYIVMEFVAGQTIDTYCDQRRLGVRDRLELFLKVASAVEYAHQHLVVHRDLKPSNILVTQDGQPKLLDFGIAKLLEDDRDITASYMRLMTPEYASPEQVAGGPITTRSDVYSLGVVLFELLTGQKPYRLRNRSIEEARDAVVRTDPPKPSTAAGRAEEGIAELRGTRRERLRRQLEEDLDNIIGMAMRKEPTARYPSVGQFAGDIRRHFAGEPVIARKDSWRYRAGKFLKRHRMAVSAAAAVMAALAIGIVVSLYNAHVADQQRALAERRFNLVRNLANSMLFEVHDAIAPLAGSTSARELIVRRAQEYLDNLSKEGGNISLDRERAAAYLRIGDVLGNPALPNLGDVKAALDNYRRAFNLNQALAEASRNDPAVLAALAANHGKICAVEGRIGDFKDAMESCGAEVKIREQIVQANPASVPARGDLADAYQRMADPHFSLGEWDRAREYREKALAIYEELAKIEPGNETWRLGIANSHNVLASVEEQARRFVLGRDHARKAVAGFQALAAAHPGDPAAQLQPTFALQRLGSLLIYLDDLPGALEAFEKALPVREQLVELDSRDMRARLNLLRSHNSIGYTLVKLGQPQRALEHFKVEEKLARELVERDPTPVEHQISLATANEDIGSVWMYDAEHAQSPAERLRNWRLSRPYFARALKIMDDLKGREALFASQNVIHERLKQEVAACDRALSGARASNP